MKFAKNHIQLGIFYRGFFLHRNNLFVLCYIGSIYRRILFNQFYYLVENLDEII